MGASDAQAQSVVEDESLRGTACLPRRLALALATLTGAIFLVALVEGVHLQLQGQAIITGGLNRLLLLLALASSHALGGLGLLAAELLILVILARARGLDTALGRLARRPNSSGGSAMISAAALVAFLSFLTGSWIKEYIFELHYISAAYDRAGYVAILGSTLNLVMTVALLGISIMLGWATYLLIHRSTEAEPRRAARFLARIWLVCQLVVLVASYTLVAYAGQFIPTPIRVLFCIWLVFLWQLLLLRLAGRRLASRAVIPVSVALLAGLLLLHPAIPTATFAPQRQILLERSRLAGSLFSGARKLADLDGDGFPGIFNGSDCDDSDPRINPAALDVPDDGKDQNCTGGDATLRSGNSAIPLQHRFQPPARQRLLWIVVDSLRFDRTGLGRKSNRDLTPNIDKFARGSAAFTNARSNSTHTAESFSSFLTSHLPSLARRANAADLHQPTMADLFLERGYKTGLVTPINLNPKFMLSGFKQVEDGLAHRKNFVYSVTSIQVTKIAAALLKAWKDDPFFLLVHYYDPHGAFIPHRAFYYGKGQQNAYDSEVAFTDMAVGALLDLLRNNKYLEDTVVIITADHGEAFGEHGAIAHGSTSYDELVHVPLLIKVPGLPPQVIKQPVGLLDLMPTVMELFRLKDTGSLQGRSLLPQLRRGDAAGATAPVYFDITFDKVNRRRGVLKDGYKFTIGLDDNLELLFDMTADPGEQNNLVVSEPERADAMRRELGIIRDQYLHAPLYRLPRAPKSAARGTSPVRR